MSIPIQIILLFQSMNFFNNKPENILLWKTVRRT